MENTLKIIKILKLGIYCQLRNTTKNCRCFSKVSKYSEKSKDIENIEKDENLPFIPDSSNLKQVKVKVWNEYSAIKKTKRDNRIYKNIESMTDYLKALQSLNGFPTTFQEFFNYLERRIVRNQLLEQKFLPERQAILKPDLAAAHFIVKRGGSVRFLGKEHWTGINHKINYLPVVYMPGFFVEAVNAEGTRLYFEGLRNLCDLNYLSWLSLKGLENMDDWCLDWISANYASNLTYLDISYCKNITYRGLSCFYRFKQLKTLNVEGISESAEFKVACIMLQEIFPDLEILGINLSIPEKITPLEEVKKISVEHGLTKV